MSSRVRSILNIVSFLSVIFMNYIANALPLNGVTQKEISAGYDSYITPAGYVFSIWGLIYLGLTFYIIIQALPKWIDHKIIRSLDLPFILSCICNISWIFVWHYFYLTISVVMMLGLLLSLIGIYICFKQDIQTDHSFLQSIRSTFNIYLGWVGLATVLNLSIWLNSLNLSYNFLSSQYWAILLLGIVCFIYLYVAFTQGEIAFIGVLAWASLGIGIRNQLNNIVYVASLLIFIVCVLSIFTILFLRPRNTA